MKELQSYLQKLAETEGPAVAIAVGVVFVAGIALSLLFDVDWTVMLQALQGALGQ